MNNDHAMREALVRIAEMTFDPWTNGYEAGEIARAALARPDAPARVLSDAEMESAFKRGGGRWDGDRWVIEDADLLPAIRAILAATTGASDAK